MPVPDPSNKPLKGFVLTRQWMETVTGIRLIFWLATDVGPVRYEVPHQEAVFFIAKEDLQATEKILSRVAGWRYSEIKLHTFEHRSVVALYFKSQSNLFDARERLGNANIPAYEADIKPVDRYLMERFITGPIEIKGQLAQRKGFKELQQGALETTEHFPQLRIASVDIETSWQGSQLYSIGVVCDDESIVFMVGENNSAMQELNILPDENSVISQFLLWLDEYDPDVIVGWNVVNFDLKFLQDCCDRLKIKFRLGRNKETVSWRKSRDGNNRFYATVPGRVVLDGIELMRTATYQFENFSLEYVSRQLLNRGKLTHDVDQRGIEITRQFNEDKDSLAKYNLEDCRLVWDIFQQENLIAFSIERSRLTGLELDRYGGSVAAFDFLYLPRLHREGFVAPILDKSRAENISPGGYVMNSFPGIYDNVIVLDFKSLYPSIIRTFHVDPLAMTQALLEEDPIEGFDGGQFSRRHYLLPKLIENLWSARDKAKQQKNAVLSQAIKIIMNSFYGILGTTGCRFFDPRLVSSITRRGHSILIKTRELIEERGYKVIYGDTDSVFVLIGDCDKSEVGGIGNKLAEELNVWWTNELSTKLGVESCLELEFETHFEKFLMPTVRGSVEGSKKRYAGMVYNPSLAPEDRTIVYKGLETVRSDWSPLARQFQRVLYQRVFLDHPYEQFIKDTVLEVLQGIGSEQLILRKRLRRKLVEYVKNVPPHVQAARKADIIRAENGLASRYADGGWIEYVMTVNGPEASQYINSKVDYQFYVDRQIAPIADSILVFKSSSMKELVDKQMGLF